MFGTQALRLLRENWPSATELAQELYAIFDDTNPTSSGPITASPAPGSTQPPLTLNQDPLTLGAISIKSGSNNATIGLNGGSLTFSVNGDSQQPVGGGGGGGVPGVVVSGGPGSGPYVVTIYPTGLSGGTQNVNVTQLSIDSGETIPAGTWTVVTQVGSNYYMQVPVWGADL